MLLMASYFIMALHSPLIIIVIKRTYNFLISVIFDLIWKLHVAKSKMFFCEFILKVLSNFYDRELRRRQMVELVIAFINLIYGENSIKNL